MTQNAMSVERLIEFWFSDRVRPLWFRSTPEFDAELRADYLATVEAAAEGRLADWERTAEGALALVIVLDQLPLNIFRGESRCFATEAAALAVAERAVAAGLDAGLSDEQKVFLYMPYMHSENPLDQDRAVALYQAAGLDGQLKYAQHHLDIVRRFGRFPHRNAILGRKSTEEEQVWLASEQAFLG